MSGPSHPIRLRLSPPAVLASAHVVVPSEAGTFADDVRDVLVAYLAGLVIFGVMLA